MDEAYIKVDVCSLRYFRREFNALVLRALWIKVSVVITLGAMLTVMQLPSECNSKSKHVRKRKYNSG
jgi:hypothetical protein